MNYDRAELVKMQKMMGILRDELHAERVKVKTLEAALAAWKTAARRTVDGAKEAFKPHGAIICHMEHEKLADALNGLSSMLSSEQQPDVTSDGNNSRISKWIIGRGHADCARDMDWHTGPECDAPGAKHPRSKCTCGYDEIVAMLAEGKPNADR